MSDPYQITYGIGTPSSIARWILFALAERETELAHVAVQLHPRILSCNLAKANFTGTLELRTLTGSLSGASVIATLSHRTLANNLYAMPALQLVNRYLTGSVDARNMRVYLYEHDDNTLEEMGVSQQERDNNTMEKRE